MNTTIIEFNQHQFEVEYIVDKEIYDKGISINSIKLDDVDFYWDLSKGSIDEIKKLILEAV
jgi:hypothetical protein